MYTAMSKSSSSLSSSFCCIDRVLIFIIIIHYAQISRVPIIRHYNEEYWRFVDLLATVFSCVFACVQSAAAVVCVSDRYNYHWYVSIPRSLNAIGFIEPPRVSCLFCNILLCRSYTSQRVGIKKNEKFNELITAAHIENNIAWIVLNRKFWKIHPTRLLQSFGG